MNPYQQRRFSSLYQQHLNALRRQGKSDSTIDLYARAVRRIADFFDRSPHALSFDELSRYFDWLISQRSWSTVKVDRNGLQFFYHHVLGKDWQWLDLVKPPQKHTLPALLSLAAFSMGLRLGEVLNLTVPDIDTEHHQVHIRQAKGYKDRFVPMPDFTLHALRRLWASHRNARWLFPCGQSPAQRAGADLPMHRGALQKAFRLIARDAGIHKPISPHSLRHAYGACLVEAGLNLRAIQQAMGHASPVTTARYTQITVPAQQHTLDHIQALVDDFVIQWGA